MKNSIYKKILSNRDKGQKLIAVLLDPDCCKDTHLTNIVSLLKTHTPDFVFVGGSHINTSIDTLIDILKKELTVDVVLFPGNANQFTKNADALLFLSLLSGRNAEFLIGQHVNSAKSIKDTGIEVIPTAYLLVDGGKTSSVAYMSNTMPIPRDKNEIALSTAIAGELLGMRLVYLEAGSGADFPVAADMIQTLSANLSIPLIVGGGVKTTEQLKQAFDAGADLVVVGNAFETNPEKITDFIGFTKEP
jgi:putative glycerol-1-phosphate prenyltransferase